MDTEDGTSNADRDRGLKFQAVSNGVGIKDGNEVHCMKNETVNNGVAIVDGNGVAEGKEVRCLKNESVNNGVAIADGNGVAEGKEFRCLKNGTVNNGVAVADGNGVANGDSGGVESLRTYKRRKHVKSSSESKVWEDRRECVEAASHLSDQVSSTPFVACVLGMVLCNVVTCQFT